MNSIWFASQNKNKIKELEEILEDIKVYSLLDLKDNQEIDETGSTFEENALIKAQYLAEKVEGIVIADDSGLCIEKLNNFPGIYSARWAYPEKDWNKVNDLILEKMLNHNLISLEDRQAYFACAIAFIDKKNNIQKTFTSHLQGSITYEQIGDNGFAYDKIFKPLGYKKTYAQMSFEEKNNISHRKITLMKLKQFLKEKNYL